MPIRNPITVPRQIGMCASRHSCRDGRRSRRRGRITSGGSRCPAVSEDLGEPEEPDGHRHHADAVAQLRHAVGEAEVAAHLVDADHAQEQPQRRHGQPLQHRAGVHVREDEQAEQQQREVLGRPEAQRERGERRRQQHQRDHAHRPRDVGAHGGDGQRRARAPLARHRVAVDARHDRGRLAGNAHQDRRRRAAVHGAVVDPGEHHERARGVEADTSRAAAG